MLSSDITSKPWLHFVLVLRWLEFCCQTSFASVFQPQVWDYRHFQNITSPFSNRELQLLTTWSFVLSLVQLVCAFCLLCLQKRFLKNGLMGIWVQVTSCVMNDNSGSTRNIFWKVLANLTHELWIRGRENKHWNAHIWLLLMFCTCFTL